VNPRTGGGVLIAVKSDIRSTHRQDLEIDNVELAVVELIRDNSMSVILYTVYHPEPGPEDLHKLNLSLQGTPESACVVVVVTLTFPL
jgi:hypothetical protein